MIYTVTLNPSLDYVVDVDDFEIGRTTGLYQKDYMQEVRESMYLLY